jgi:methionine biosynthesis protein MetW
MNKNIIAKLKGVFIDLFKYPTVDFNKSVNYDDYWAEERDLDESFRPRFRVIAKQVGESSHILDCGCGDGTLAEYLTSLGHQVVGFDISNYAIKLARKVGINATQLDIRNTNKLRCFLNKFSFCFDYSVLSEVIEHVENSEEILKIISEKSKVLIVTIPNTGYYIHRLRLLFGKFPIQWLNHPGEHLRFWTLVDFRYYVDKLDLKVIQTIPLGGIKKLHLILPNLFAKNYLFLLKKKN